MLFDIDCHPSFSKGRFTWGGKTKTQPAQRFLIIIRSLACKRRIIMRINFLFFLMTANMLNIYATGVSQELSFSGKNIRLTKIFYFIRRETGFVVFYDNNLVKKSNLTT